MRTLPKIFSQRDPQWASQRLGTVDGTTIGQYGCFITSFAMTANFYGKDINPAQLDDLFTNNGLYADSNLCTDDGLQKAYSDVQYVSTVNYPNDPADLNKLKELLSDPSQIVILELDFDHDPNDGIQTHFVVAVDCDGTNVTIADPWYGTQNNFSEHYGNNPSQTIQKFVVYKGNSAQDPLQACLAQHATLVDLCNQKDATIAQLKTANESQASSIQTLQDKIKDLEGQVSSLNDENTGLKTNISEVQKQNADLADTLKTHNESDSTAIDTGIQAQTALKNLLVEKEEIATRLNCDDDQQSILKAIDSKDSQIALTQKEKANQANLFDKYIQIFIKTFIRGGK